MGALAEHNVSDLRERLPSPKILELPEFIRDWLRDEYNLLPLVTPTAGARYAYILVT